ncbi:MAG: transcriptional repressor NrdR [Chloroflexi bacterium]|nr:transcriptional repressor NrdR [Chloroflexota bacterium]
MNCPFCGFSDSKVTDSRVVENGIRRRRECQECGDRFTTYERIQTTSLMVTKQDNRREEFDRDKLLSGIRKACTKRPVPSRTIEKLVADIEAELQSLGQSEVRSNRLGTMVMDRLKDIDRVAYIRFASVYRDFQDIESFEEAVKDLKGENTQLPLLKDAPPAPRPTRRRGRPPGARSQPGNGRFPGKSSSEQASSRISLAPDQESTGETGDE